MFVLFVFMVRIYLVGQYCKKEVNGLNKIVDYFVYSFLHPLLENILLFNKEVDF